MPLEAVHSASFQLPVCGIPLRYMGHAEPNFLPENALINGPPFQANPNGKVTIREVSDGTRPRHLDTYEPFPMQWS